MVLPETTGIDPTITYLHGLGLVVQLDGTGAGAQGIAPTARPVSTR
jgi:hypothetical protein